MRKSTASKDDSNATSPPDANGRQQQQQQQQSGSYSSIVGSLQSQNGSENRTARGDNPFKYGKDEIMQVYSSLVGNGDKTSHTPLDFERYDQVTSSLPVQPVSTNELTSDERALLAGNINSEKKTRRPEEHEARQNGRRDNRANGGPRDSKKHDNHRKAGEESIHRNSQPPTTSDGRTVGDNDHAAVSTTQESSDSQVDSNHENSRGQASGRNTSRLATMGVFDNSADGASSSKWKDDKDDDVLKEAMGYADNGNQDIDRLTDMYQNQTLGATNTQSSQTSRSYAEQQYNPLSNGMPDLFSKGPNSAMQYPSQQQGPQRGGFMDSTPSPGLPMRQDPPMTRVMVMPDKLKWQYRDPTGQNQGPFSGLEMHDWYKAGFFQPNLLVKREEDEDFEPLSILVRRIGNQREPFLVPLPSRVTTVAQPARSGSQDGKESWPNGQNWSGGGQPPFPQSFPSFGTTLTAEQQNALERRKQEEQYLMHRQREFLQQQQMAQQMAAQRLLHHQNPYGGHNGQSFGYGVDRRSSPFSNGSERQGSMSSFDMGGGSGGGNGGWGGYAPQHQNAHRGQYTDFGAGIFDTPKSEVAEQSFRDQGRFDEDTLDDFKQNNQRQEQTSINKKITHQDYASRMAQQAQAMQRQVEAGKQESTASTRQVEQISNDSIQAPDSAFDLASLLNEETQPASGQPVQRKSEAQEATPEAELDLPTTPSAAPWAAAPTARGLSLKEIQQIEAKRDSLRREAERKAAQEVQAQAEASVIPAAPLVTVPLNWAAESTTDGPATPGAAWKASSATPGKKTLAQIQQEEEAVRKAKVVALAKAQAQGAVTQPAAGAMAVGMRYADTAMKTSGQSWSTVGSGGKISAPSTPRLAEQKLPVTAQPSALKTTRVAAVPAVQQVARPSDPDKISPEFLNWARSALKGLSPGVNFAEFLQLLLSFGTDGGKDTREIISDSIYANSATLDGRRFADEFCKRRKEDLKNTHGQNKSISELTSTLASSSASSNGWSDVVKTKPVKQDMEEEWNTSFKLQAKKGGKRK